ncbi:FAD binding domain-containing protein [bacterium]|nr:FAD binding domain-containing protein [bacterium]
MILPPFLLHRPTTVDEAVDLAALHQEEGVSFLAGGTDLLPNWKNRLNNQPHLISLQSIPSLHDVESGKIGALATLHSLLGFSPLPQGLREAIEVVASPLIRTTATIGGNLLLDTRCHFFNQSPFWRATVGSCLKAEGPVCRVVPGANSCVATFSSDLAPLLMAMDATLSFVGPQGERSLPLRTFYQQDGIRRMVLKPGEILTTISWHDDPTLLTGYAKLRIREAWDFPLLGVGCAMGLCEGYLSNLSLFLGAVDSIPIEVPTESFLGEPLTDEAIEVIAKSAYARVKPMKNVGLTPSYRKRMVPVFVRRLLMRLRGDH